MMMGKLVSHKKYEYYEYVTAIFISVGMALFLLGSTENHKGKHWFNNIVMLHIILLPTGLSCMHVTNAHRGF